jgi:hypothetical protein
MAGLKLWIALICLAMSLAAPVFFFMGSLDKATFRGILLAAAIGWFVFATAWAVRRSPRL